MPYLIARPPVRSAVDLSPLGIAITPEHIFDPQRVQGRVFISLVKRLDAMTYGPQGLSMPDWVFYDCAVMPGAVFGFASRASDLPDWVRRGLGVPADHHGLVPMSMLIAIPMAHRQSTLVYTLCSINQVTPGAAPEGLWRLTLAAGSKALCLPEMVATMQWRSPRLSLFSGLGPLHLMTAWTPAHDNPATCTFRVATTDGSRSRLLDAELPPTEHIQRYVDPDDEDALRGLQMEIEDGLDVAVAGPTEIRGAETRVPLAVRTEHDERQEERDKSFVRRFQG